MASGSDVRWFYESDDEKLYVSEHWLGRRSNKRYLGDAQSGAPAAGPMKQRNYGANHQVY
jgi:hypothetical protein